MPLLSDSLCRASGVPASESLEEMVCGTLCARMGFLSMNFPHSPLSSPPQTCLPGKGGGIQ